jgi:hypothetical protein
MLLEYKEREVEPCVSLVSLLGVGVEDSLIPQTGLGSVECLQTIIRGLTYFSRAFLWSHSSGHILIYGVQNSSSSGKGSGFCWAGVHGKRQKGGTVLKILGVRRLKEREAWGRTAAEA